MLRVLPLFTLRQALTPTQLHSTDTQGSLHPPEMAFDPPSTHPDPEPTTLSQPRGGLRAWLSSLQLPQFQASVSLPPPAWGLLGPMAQLQSPFSRPPRPAAPITWSR